MINRANASIDTFNAKIQRVDAVASTTALPARQVNRIGPTQNQLAGKSKALGN
jgi:hypothetical protein